MILSISHHLFYLHCALISHTGLTAILALCSINLDVFMDERGVEGYGPSAGQWDKAQNGSAQTRRAEGPVSEL